MLKDGEVISIIIPVQIENLRKQCANKISNKWEYCICNKLALTWPPAAKRTSSTTFPYRS